MIGWIQLGLAALGLALITIFGIFAAEISDWSLALIFLGALSVAVAGLVPLVIWRCPYCRGLLPVGRGITAQRTQWCQRCERNLS